MNHVLTMLQNRKDSVNGADKVLMNHMKSCCIKSSPQKCNAVQYQISMRPNLVSGGPEAVLTYLLHVWQVKAFTGNHSPLSRDLMSSAE